MESKQSHFRPEAMNHRLNRSLGSVRLNIPFNHHLMALCSIGLLLGLVFFILFAKTNEQIKVRGFLDLEQGIVTIQTPVNGRVIKRFVNEGSKVNKGSLMFLIATENKEYRNNLKQRQANMSKEYQLAKQHYQSVKTLWNRGYASAASLKEVKIKQLELANQMKLLDLEYEKYQQQHRILAPIDGVVTNILYKPGQSFESNKPLLHLIPKTCDYFAQIYVPSEHIGFLKKGHRIHLHYDAYPAQRFGFYQALIEEINLTVLTDDQETKPIKIGKPYYKIKAKLINPYVLVYGNKTPLSHGLTLTALINSERKTIWQWFLDPLYSHKG